MLRTISVRTVTEFQQICDASLAQMLSFASPRICLLLIQTCIDLSYLEPRQYLILTSIAFPKFGKTFYAISTIIEHLCPFQTFTILPKVCKVYTRRWWLIDPAATNLTVINFYKTVQKVFGLQETRTSSPVENSAVVRK